MKQTAPVSRAEPVPSFPSQPTNTPRVSVLLPCLNARRFLEARIDSLLTQTMPDWEAIVLDSYSDDGSWEYFESIAATDQRFLLHRLPREGLYAALNRGLELPRGEFLHIATCDDTMEPGFLDTMLTAFAQAPEAGIAACDLRFIDADGRDTVFATRFGAERVRTATLAEQTKETNYRPPPYDCMLHLAGDTVYYSLTQLLVRTALAQRAPHFETGRASYADFGWSLNMTNLAGTVHVPQKLATWRLHGDQLSVKSEFSHSRYIADMCGSGLPRLYREHRALFSSNDYAALFIPAKMLFAQAAGRWDRMLLAWLEGLIRLLWMCVERPLPSFRALLDVRFHRRHLKQAWIALMMRRLGLQPRPVG